MEALEIPERGGNAFVLVPTSAMAPTTARWRRLKLWTTLLSSSRAPTPTSSR